MLLKFLAAVVLVLGLVSAEDPYRYFDWNVTYHICSQAEEFFQTFRRTLGVQPRGRTSSSKGSLRLFPWLPRGRATPLTPLWISHCSRPLSIPLFSGDVSFNPSPAYRSELGKIGLWKSVKLEVVEDKRFGTLKFKRIADFDEREMLGKECGEKVGYRSTTTEEEIWSFHAAFCTTEGFLTFVTAQMMKFLDFGFQDISVGESTPVCYKESFVRECLIELAYGAKHGATIVVSLKTFCELQEIMTSTIDTWEDARGRPIQRTMVLAEDENNVKALFRRGKARADLWH